MKASTRQITLPFEFVARIQLLSGEAAMTFNTHPLTHLPKSVKSCGHIWHLCLKMRMTCRGKGWFDQNEDLLKVGLFKGGNIFFLNYFSLKKNHIWPNIANTGLQSFSLWRFKMSPLMHSLVSFLFFFFIYFCTSATLCPIWKIEEDRSLCKWYLWSPVQRLQICLRINLQCLLAFQCKCNL